MAYYDEQLAAGQKFQDYIAEQLYRAGVVLVNFQSRDFQLARGENLLGLEIKFDRQYAHTGNLWIEVAERAAPDHAWIPSGIYRGDNAWLYGIGDHTEFFIFSIKLLRLLVERPGSRFVVHVNTLCTSRGFLLPRADAHRYADKVHAWAQ